MILYIAISEVAKKVIAAATPVAVTPANHATGSLFEDSPFLAIVLFITFSNTEIQSAECFAFT